MDINPVTRHKQLENLEQFISNSRKSLHSILTFLNWTPEKVTEGNSMITCTKNVNHRVPTTALQEHLETCDLKTLGYNTKDMQLSEPLNIPKASIYIDNRKKAEILSSAHRNTHNFKTGWNGIDPDPRTADQLTSTFTSDERLALYNYARNTTKGPPELPEFSIVHPPTTDRELTYEEILEQERNAKRRRIKYKTVPTNRKNHTEVIRDVISNQMGQYQEWLEEKVCSNGKNYMLVQEIEDNSYDEQRLSISQTSDHSANSKDYSIYSEKKREMSCDKNYKRFPDRSSASQNLEKRKRDYNDERYNHSDYRSKKNKYNRM